MPDREKVTYDIERCICRVPDACRDCSHYQDDRLDCMEKLLADALALLKEQEAKWVEDKQDEHCRLIKCSNCGLTFIVGNNIPYDEWIEDRNYCMRCGARMNGVKWE